MKKISKEAALLMRKQGIVFKPHSLYQSEQTAVLVEIRKNVFRPYQIK